MDDGTLNNRSMFVGVVKVETFLCYYIENLVMLGDMFVYHTEKLLLMR